ncbi:MAG: biotin/lipoyl-binding protein, partial [Janthinobacterium lividum]
MAQVSVVTVQPHAVALSWEYAGRVVAFRRTEVRARVGGLLLRRRYTEGARVAAGDVLVRLDPAPYEAAVAHAAALVQQAEAQRDKAGRDERRA